jgi:DNA-binding CsgD family transcriptional regulator/catechol 2,3-dioxygenase-like lactoylglutathione lyase family enzyme
MAEGGRRGRPPHPDVLTPAEWAVVDAVRHGMSNRQIAARRGISLDAVKFHVANARDKLGVDSRTSLRHWRGRRNGAARTEGGLGMESTTFALGPVGQISMTVSDIARSEAWYRDVLGLPHLYTFGTLAFFDCDGTRLYLGEPENGKMPDDQSVLYFRVPDIDAAFDTLKGRGVEFEGAPHLIHRHENGIEEWMAFFRDPDRHILALMSQVPPK